MTSAVATAEPTERWSQLTILAFGMVLAMSPSFAAAAVAPILREDWAVGPLDLPFLTVVVQLGFAVARSGWRSSARPDVIPGRGCSRPGRRRGRGQPRLRPARDGSGDGRSRSAS